jgi:hypothetical protein
MKLKFIGAQMMSGKGALELKPRADVMLSRPTVEVHMHIFVA